MFYPGSGIGHADRVVCLALSQCYFCSFFLLFSLISRLMCVAFPSHGSYLHLHLHPFSSPSLSVVYTTYLPKLVYTQQQQKISSKLSKSTALALSHALSQPRVPSQLMRFQILRSELDLHVRTSRLSFLVLQAADEPRVRRQQTQAGWHPVASI